MERPTRRRLLRAGGLAGVAGLTAAAGCSGFLGSGDGGSTPRTTGDGDGDGTGNGATTGGDGTTTPGDPAAFRRWLPAPGAFDGSDRYDFDYHDLAGFRAHADALHPRTGREVKRLAEGPASTLGVSPGAVGGLLRVGFGGVAVVTGSFDRSAVASGLGSDYSKTDSYGGYDLYAGGTDPPAVAVGDSTALLCPETGANQPLAVARLLVDAERGDARRYHEVDAAFDALSDDLAGATRAQGTRIPPPEESAPAEGRFRGNVGLGVGFTVDADVSELLMVLVFEGEAPAPADRVRTWTEESLAGLDQYRDYGVEERGRTVRVTGTVDTGRLDFLAAGDPGER